MDYTPITVGRVLSAFALTVVVGLAPVMVIALRTPGGYGGVTLGLGIIAVLVAIIRLTRLTTANRRHVVGRPSRA